MTIRALVEFKTSSERKWLLLEGRKWWEWVPSKTWRKWIGYPTNVPNRDKDHGELNMYGNKWNWLMPLIRQLLSLKLLLVHCLTCNYTLCNVHRTTWYNTAGISHSTHVWGISTPNYSFPILIGEHVQLCVTMCLSVCVRWSSYLTDSVHHWQTLNVHVS